MKWPEYLVMSEKTLSTQFYIETQHSKNMLHAVMGLDTECGELLGVATQIFKNEELDLVNIKEELGDIMWYIAIFDREFPVDPTQFRGPDLGAIENVAYAIISLTQKSTEMLDLMKKYTFYGKGVNSQEFDKLRIDIKHHVSAIAFTLGFALEDIAQTNIDKLKARYGDKFSEEAAINRDLDNEREILES